MAKINYTKIEQQIQRVLQEMQKKQLEEGKTPISSRAQEYYGVTKEARPVPQEVVELLLEKEREEEVEEEKPTPPSSSEPISLDFPVLSEEAPELLPPSSEQEVVVEGTPAAETLYQYPKTKKAVPKRPQLQVDLSQTSDKTAEKVSPLYVLRQHIFWMKRQHIDKRYELIGTTREEVGALRKKERLQAQDMARIQELIQKAVHVRTVWEKKRLGAASTEELIEIQKKRAKQRRFNVRDKWLPL